jgi:hypothetical protein
MRIELAGHLLSRAAVSADCLLASRPLIEGHIRRRVLALPNVVVLQRCSATALILSAGGGGVAGLRVQPAAVAGSVAEVLDGELVVAVTGRGGGVARRGCGSWAIPVRTRRGWQT